MVAVPIPWAKRTWALPFLTILAPSARWAETNSKRHKTLTTSGPGRRSCKPGAGCQIAVWCSSPTAASQHSSYLAAVRGHVVCMITRLRLDANLFRPAPKRRPGQWGRTPLKGRALPKLSAVLKNKKTIWTSVVVSQWAQSPSSAGCSSPPASHFGHRAGIAPVPIRWVLVRDPSGEHEPAAFLSTGSDAQPATILGWFVSRWRLETTFQEVRAHLGVETQRQWSDLAILRTTPALLGLFSLITVWADGLARDATNVLRPNVTAWYRKSEPTFSDAIAAVRRVLWAPPNFSMSRQPGETITIAVSLLNRVLQTLCLAA